MKLIKWLDKHFEESILMFFLVLISCVMMLQVIMRKVFNSSLTWPEEFCRYCYVWTVFFSLAFTVKYGNMLRVGVVVDMFPKVLRKLTGILANIACLVFFVVFFLNSIEVVQAIGEMGQTSPAMRWPMNLVYTCTVIGFGLAALRTLQSLYRQIRYFNDDIQSTLDAVKEEAEAEAALAASDLSRNK